MEWRRMFELILNRNAEATLGIALPPAMQLRAVRVIE